MERLFYKFKDRCGVHSSCCFCELIDLIDEGLKDQTVIRVCIHVYRRLAEKKMFGNQVTTDRAWDAMNLAIMDELHCSVKLIEATIKEIIESR